MGGIPVADLDLITGVGEVEDEIVTVTGHGDITGSDAGTEDNLIVDGIINIIHHPLELAVIIDGIGAVTEVVIVGVTPVMAGEGVVASAAGVAVGDGPRISTGIATSEGVIAGAADEGVSPAPTAPDEDIIAVTAV